LAATSGGLAVASDALAVTTEASAVQSRYSGTTLASLSSGADARIIPTCDPLRCRDASDRALSSDGRSSNGWGDRAVSCM